MVKKHLKRIAAPKTWSIKRKEQKWIIRPMPGPHPLRRCIPLGMVVRNMLKYAKTTREAKILLNDGKILVNKVVRKDLKFPVGIMDVVEAPEIKEYFRMVYNKQGKLIPIPIKEEEARIKPVKITNKTTLKGKKTQLNFSDGTNMIVEKDTYKVNDTIILDLTKEKKERIKKHLKMEKGAKIYLTDGKHIGTTGTIEDIQKTFKKQTIVFKSGEETYKTSKNFALIIDDSISTGAK